MWYWWLILGVLIGWILAMLYIHLFSTAYGMVRIDNSNPEKDRFMFEINGPIDILYKSDRVVFKIDHNANFSQE